jgi:hypothetical protein
MQLWPVRDVVSVIVGVPMTCRRVDYCGIWDGIRGLTVRWECCSTPHGYWSRRADLNR